MKKKIQIGVACGLHSEKYIELLIHSVNKTASNENEIEFLLGISDPNEDYKKYHSEYIGSVDRNYINNIQSKYAYKIIDIITEDRSTNFRHGKALDELFKHFDSDYAMFIDCDVAMLTDNWDVKMMNKLVDNIVIIGCEYPSYRSRKYRKFPNATFCMFKTAILKEIDISFVPISRHGQDFVKIDEAQAKLFCCDNSRALILDVGWQLPIKIKQNGYDGLYLSALRKGGFVHNKSDGATEYQLDREPIATHKGRSSGRSLDDNPSAIIWKKNVLEYLSKGKIIL